jgi:hypothetical protein
MISKDKTALIPKYTRNREKLTIHPSIIKRRIQIFSQMKYLGVTLDFKMDWYPHTLYLERKLPLIRNSLSRCSKATWGLTYHNLLTIYKHAIFPGIMYAAEAWRTSLSK